MASYFHTKKWSKFIDVCKGLANLYPLAIGVMMISLFIIPPVTFFVVLSIGATMLAVSGISAAIVYSDMKNNPTPGVMVFHNYNNEVASSNVRPEVLKQQGLAKTIAADFQPMYSFGPPEPDSVQANYSENRKKFF